MTEEELDRLTDILAAARDAPLSEWERNFMSDMEANVNRWGTAVHVSYKQWKILNDILEKCN
jgi:hypothetical protein